MRYKVFGRRTGLRVSELALGAGNFGTGWGHGAERDEAGGNFLDGFVEAGGNFLRHGRGVPGGIQVSAAAKGSRPDSTEGRWKSS
jgi:hypothetical protein